MPSLALSSAPQSFRPSMRDTLQACGSTPAPTADDDRQGRCAYPSKPCPNARAVKLNGDCHNFCEFHRRKANMNQRRWQQRRRRLRHVGDGAASPSNSHEQQLTPRSDASRSDEMESAQAVVMLQRAGNNNGRYSPVPAHNWPRYPAVEPTPPQVQWAPRHTSPMTQPAPMYNQTSYVRSTSVNMLESTLPHAVGYTPPSLAMGGCMIPPLRSLPLPPLLPSVLVPLKASTSPPRASASASVYTC